MADETGKLYNPIRTNWDTHQEPVYNKKIPDLDFQPDIDNSRISSRYQLDQKPLPDSGVRGKYEGLVNPPFPEGSSRFRVVRIGDETFLVDERKLTGGDLANGGAVPRHLSIEDMFPITQRPRDGLENFYDSLLRVGNENGDQKYTGLVNPGAEPRFRVVTIGGADYFITDGVFVPFGKHTQPGVQRWGDSRQDRSPFGDLEKNLQKFYNRCPEIDSKPNSE